MSTAAAPYPLGYAYCCCTISTRIYCCCTISTRLCLYCCCTISTRLYVTAAAPYPLGYAYTAAAPYLIGYAYCCCCMLLLLLLHNYLIKAFFTITSKFCLIPAVQYIPPMCMARPTSTYPLKLCLVHCTTTSRYARCLYITYAISFALIYPY